MATGRRTVRILKYQGSMTHHRMAVPVSSVGDMTVVTVLGPTARALTRINNTVYRCASRMTGQTIVAGNTLGMGLQTLDYRVAYRMTVITR